MTKVATRTFDHTHPTVFQPTFNVYEYVSNAKNQAISLFSSRDIFELNIMQFDLPRALLPISQEPDFSQILDWCRSIPNNIFIIDQIQEKLMTKCFN